MSTIINTTGHTTGITLTDADSCKNTTHIENGDSRITIFAHTDEYPQLVADLALHLTTITPNPGHPTNRPSTRRSHQPRSVTRTK